jgi:hypothetical protein
VAEANGVTAAEAALAWVLALSPAVVVIPGARRPETARSIVRAASVQLKGAAPTRRRLRRGRVRSNLDVVLVMGIPGAGKSRLAADYVERGYLRLNRDERGGSLRDVARALDESLADGATRVVLDNTYLARASRNDVIDAAARHGAGVSCVWADTPLAQAQVNLVERLLDRVGSLPEPDELRALARSEPGVLAPTSQMRAVRELEPPGTDEGFSSIEVVPFVRAAGDGVPGVLVAAAAHVDVVDADTPHLVFDWHPDGDRSTLDATADRLAAAVRGPLERALCPHPAGPPRCWCRPPLPGLPLVFARSHGIDLTRSVLVGDGPAHRTLAAGLGARYVAAARCES